MQEFFLKDTVWSVNDGPAGKWYFIVIIFRKLLKRACQYFFYPEKTEFYGSTPILPHELTMDKSNRTGKLRNSIESCTYIVRKG